MCRPPHSHACHARVKPVPDFCACGEMSVRTGDMRVHGRRACTCSSKTRTCSTRATRHSLMACRETSVPATPTWEGLGSAGGGWLFLVLFLVFGFIFYYFWFYSCCCTEFATLRACARFCTTNTLATTLLGLGSAGGTWLLLLLCGGLQAASGCIHSTPATPIWEGLGSAGGTWLLIYGIKS